MTQFEKAIPINISGGSYSHSSRPLSSQKTLNFYPMVEAGGKEQFILHPFPGLKTMGNVSGSDRGMYVFKKEGYRVAGEHLYKFTYNGTHLNLGKIPGSGQCTFADDGESIFVCHGNGARKYNDTDGMSTVTDANIINAETITSLNNQAIYVNNNLFQVSDAGVFDEASGLNAAGAESNPDDLIRAYAYKQMVYMFGAHTIEPWWNTGVGLPPFERMEGRLINVGLGAKHSIAHTDNYLYWLGDDHCIYRTNGGAHEVVSSQPISAIIESFSNIHDAKAYTFSLDGCNFYLITFPSMNKTLCVNEKLGDKGWFDVASGLNSGMYQGTSAIKVYGKTYVADYDNGNLYQLDKDTFTNNGDIIQRQRVTSSVNSKLLGGRKNLRVQMSRLELDMEKGVGVITGQGEDPLIVGEVSHDGGRSWKQLGNARVGRLGEFTLKVEFFCLDSFYDAIFRFTTSDPTPYYLYSASIDLRLAGW